MILTNITIEKLINIQCFWYGWVGESKERTIMLRKLRKEINKRDNQIIRK